MSAIELVMVLVFASAVGALFQWVIAPATLRASGGIGPWLGERIGRWAMLLRAVDGASVVSQMTSARAHWRHLRENRQDYLGLTKLVVDVTTPVQPHAVCLAARGQFLEIVLRDRMATLNYIETLPVGSRAPFVKWLTTTLLQESR